MAGALFQDGDTITIRIQVAQDQLIVTMEPSGLLFDPFEPAELELRYPEADDDYDDDGTPDPERETRIDPWLVERPEPTAGSERGQDCVPGVPGGRRAGDHSAGARHRVPYSVRPMPQASDLYRRQNRMLKRGN